MNVKAYLLHTRPQSYPVTFFAAFTGYALSPARPETVTALLTDLGLLALVFSVLLWGGTNAFNSGQDGDSGPLTLLPEPPPVPKYLNRFGLALMTVAVLLAGLISITLMFWTATGLLLSVWYSWKNPYLRRGKDIPVADMLINTVGFGFCSVLFGYLLTAAPITPELLFIGVGFTFAYLGGMPTSQIFQLNGQLPKERNYTSMFGAGTILKTGAVFFFLHLVFLAWGYTDVAFLQNNLVAFMCWSGWALLVLASAVHSFWWSGNPYKNAYNRMNRQMVMMMTSQLLWTAYAWMKS